MKNNKKILQCHADMINEENIFDDNKLHKCCKLNLAQYEKKMGQMSLEELQSLAQELGLIPIDNRDLLIKSIKREFKNL